MSENNTQNVSTEQEIKNDVQKEELKTETKEEAQEVKETTEAPAVDEVDYEALLKDKDEKIAKIETEKDNYRKMALKYKKGEETSEEVAPELSDEEKLRAIVKEELFNTDLAKAQKEKDDLIAKLVRKNKELEVANRNSVKSNLSVGGGGNEERKHIDNSISPEKLNELYKFADDAGLDRESFIKRYKENSRNKIE